MLNNSKWITFPHYTNELICPIFKKQFNLKSRVKSATLKITSLGCYYAELNGKRIGDFILAPGWTIYNRAQVQEYNVKSLLSTENNLEITLGAGWFKGRINPRNNSDIKDVHPAILCELKIIYISGEIEYINSNEDWVCSKSKITFSDIYDGEHYNALYKEDFSPVKIQENFKVKLVKQEGEKICEQETLPIINVIKTPKGETVLDFGQNLTGYFEFNVVAKKGDLVDFTFGEVLDKNGNFYNENYRSAKAEFKYICKDGYQQYKPKLTFYGYRYIKVNSFPTKITKDNIVAIVVHSDIKRTGYLTSSNKLLNKLFENIIWGQKGNFLDVPTDCPQRDERLGWTGDAQVFIKTATYNYNVKKFFNKWLTDLKLEQKREGIIPFFIPQARNKPTSPSAAWSDAATICPWQIYMSYGDVNTLKKQYVSMKAHVDYVTKTTKKANLWFGCWHYGDWLGLDAPEGSYEGSSSRDIIASAFYAHSTSLLVKAGKIIGKNVERYEKLYNNIVKTFKETFTEFNTQTECALVLHFNLTDDKISVSKKLAELIINNGKKLQTGFVGTPYLLHALSENGYTELAYDLLLQEDYPSWLYSVKQGATTIWEHWDGVNDKGEFWSSDMNSFNHYAYGSVADWVYEVACGIKPVEQNPGFNEVVIEPHPTKKLKHLKAEYNSINGKIISAWENTNGKFTYHVTVPVNAKIIIEGKIYKVTKGSYKF